MKSFTAVKNVAVPIQNKIFKTLAGFILFIFFQTSSYATGFSGTYTIGPSAANYTSIKNALAVFNQSGNSITAPVVLELQATYVSTVEATFPLVIGVVNGSSATNTVTIRPAAAATALSIVNNSGVTVNISGGKNIIIDGRPGGTGTAKELTLEASSTGGTALQFINEASNNTIRYCKIKGANTSTSSGGVIVFGSTNGANGNDNNTLSNNDIGDNTYTPVNLIFGFGNSNTTATNNSGNTVSSCNIFNFFATAGTANGIYLRSGNTDWTITGNSFYQTVSRAFTGDGGFYGININNNTGNNFTINNNYIGGSSGSAGGSAWTQSGLFKLNFTPINVIVGTATASNIQGNIIKNINVSTSAANVVAGLINVGNGSVNVGTSEGNTIGSTTTTNSIVYNCAGGNFQFNAILGNSNSTNSIIKISNNTIGSINLTAATTTSFRGVSIQGAVTKYTVYKNLIGSETVANSITNAGSVTTFGIYSVSTSTENNIVENTIVNLEASGTGTAVYLYGVSIQSGVNIISGNIIHDLVSPTTYGAQGVIGINFTASGTPNQVISKNTIYALSNTNTTSANVNVTGILYNGSSAGTNKVSGNFVHSLSVASNNITSGVIGISGNAGTATFDNNMVRLGIKADGSSLTGGYAISGLFMQAATPSSKFYHNSVYIGGSGVAAGTSITAAFNRSTANYSCDLRNNILVNTRANTVGGGAKHYAIRLQNANDYTAAYLSSNYNILYTPNADDYVGNVNGTFYKTLADWRSATGFDLSAIAADPNFTDATSGVSSVNLHVSNPTPVEAAGTLVSSVVYDFDSTVRSTTTPVDIGADAANFTALSDQSPPNIVYTPLSRDIAAPSRALPAFAAITDNVGVSGGLNSPRLYFKKSVDTDVFSGNTSATNGWKYVVASNTVSPYSFTIDYSILRAASVSIGDVIQYFVVAQDDANNFSTSPSGATAGSPPVQNVTAKPTLINAYNISDTLYGTKIIPGNYSSITGAGGLFADINSKVLSGNLSLIVVGNLLEDGTNALNQWAESGAGNYTVSITSDATGHTITSSGVATSTPMININGADRFSISGGTGTQRRLTLRNTNSTASATGPTIQFTNGSVSSSLSNCIVENNGTATSSANIVIGSGINNVTITSNDIGNATAGTTGPAYNAIYANGSTSTNTLNISSNNIYNFTAIGLNFPSLSLADGCTFSGNNLYQTSGAPSQVTTSTSITGISLNSGSGHTIQNNFIGGQAAGATGSAYSNTAAVNFKGIDLALGANATTTLAGNKISNIYLSNTTTTFFTGLNISAGSITASGNVIGDVSTAASIQTAGNSPVYGINVFGADSVTLINDTIANIKSDGTGAASQVIGIYANPGTRGYSITLNVVDKLKTAGYTVTNEGSVAGISLTGSNTNNVITRNIISNLENTGTGAIVPRLTGLFANNGAGGTFSRNRIYNLLAANTSNPDIKGIYLTQNSDPFVLVANNQIALGNSYTGNAVLQGISDSTTPAFTSKIYFNTVYLGGTVTSGTANTAAWYRFVPSISETKNNIFYNDRTGGTGSHYAISFPAIANNAGSTNDYDMLVTADATKLAEYGAGVNQTLTQFKTNTGGATNSRTTSITTFPSSTGFTSLAAGNLGLGTAYKYLVGARGTMVSETIDYAGTVRNATPGMGSIEYGVQTGVWIGITDTAWLNVTNWGDNFVPLSTTNVVVPVNAPFMPYVVAATGTQAINDLSVNSGATLTLNNATLKIAGSITNAGSFAAANGTVEMNGTSPQTIPAGAFASNNLKNLIVSNNVTVGGQLNITNAVWFGNINSKVLAAGGFLTLKSTATSTARIADVTNAGANSANTITGDVVIERYLAGLNTRAYRLLAPGVNSASSAKTYIWHNWQEGVNNPNTSTNYNPLPGYGTHITGSMAGANGFDATQTGNSSLFTYVYGPADAYAAITNTNAVSLEAKTGYLVYVRGDRIATHLTGLLTSGNTTLRSTGTVLIGDVTYTMQGDSKFTLATNPYASQINWSNIYADGSTGLENYYTYLDPAVGTRGSYVTVTNGGVRSTPTNASTEIQSGQAFFVKSTPSGTHALTIKETHKATGSNTSVFRAGSQEQLSIALYFYLPGGARRLADGVNILYNNNYSAAVDGNDAEQIANFDEDIAIKRGGKLLSIEGRPLIDETDTIFLNMAKTKEMTYELEFAPNSFNAPQLQAYLQDKFLNSETPINLNEATVIPFTVTANVATAASDRFKLVFRGGLPLPLNFTLIKAYQKGNAVQVDWNMGTESSIKEYEIEKSVDGRTFTKVGRQVKRGQASSDNYGWLDATPNNGNNYYRIKAIEQNGQYKYSQVVNVNIGKGNTAISVYPNPVKGGTISLQLVNKPKGTYAIRLFNAAGQQVYSSLFEHAGGSAATLLVLNSRLAKGVYELQATNGTTKTTCKVISE